MAVERRQRQFGALAHSAGKGTQARAPRLLLSQNVRGGQYPVIGPMSGHGMAMGVDPPSCAGAASIMHPESNGIGGQTQRPDRQIGEIPASQLSAPQFRFVG